MDLVERAIFIRFLNGLATAQEIAEINADAGTALQELGEIAPDPEVERFLV